MPRGFSRVGLYVSPPHPRDLQGLSLQLTLDDALLFKGDTHHSPHTASCLRCVSLSCGPRGSFLHHQQLQRNPRARNVQ